MIHFAAKIERNDPCWCGSGKKYKSCHMRVDEKIRAFRAKVAGPKGELPHGILCAALGCVAVWSCLFGCGYLIYGYGGVENGYALGGGLLALSAAATKKGKPP